MDGVKRCSHCRKTWTAEQTERVYKLYREGFGASEIARRLGLTKGAVIGKMWREAWCVRDAAAVQTMEDRLAALHAKMDEVMALPVPRIAPPTEVSAGVGPSVDYVGKCSRSVSAHIRS